MISADDLVILLEVARRRTFAGAASATGVNHTTISRRISALEAAVGESLVTRSTTGVQLTDAGRQVLEAAEAVDRALTRVRVRSDRPSSKLTGLVNISAPEAFGVRFVAPVIARLHKRHPDVSFELMTQSRAKVKGSGADIEIGARKPTSQTVTYFELTSYVMGLFASEEYLHRVGEPHEIGDLAHHSVIYYLSPLLQTTAIPSLTSLFTQGVQIGCTSIFAQLEATKAGAGIGILPTFLAATEPCLDPILRKETAMPMKYYASLAPRVLRRPAAAETMRQLQIEVHRRRHELLGDGVLPAAS